MLVDLRLRLCAAILLLLTCAAMLAQAQSAAVERNTVTLGADEPAQAAKADKVLHAFRITKTPPKIDGLLNDEVWTLAPTAEGLIQWDPDNGSPLTEGTLIQVAYDDRYLYVGVRCLDRMPDLIARGLGRRYIRRRAETGEWTARPRGERGEVSRWGHLVFDDALAPPRRIEIQPYPLARAERQPGISGTGLDGSAGADLRLGIGTSATLSATVNPDFGQPALTYLTNPTYLTY